MQESSDDILKTNEEFIEETGVDGFIDAFNGWIIVLTPNQIKQFESETDRITEDDCGGVCGVGMSAGFQAQAPENPIKVIDPSGKLPLEELKEFLGRF